LPTLLLPTLLLMLLLRTTTRTGVSSVCSAV
jgi:hypothetical protein